MRWFSRACWNINVWTALEKFNLIDKREIKKLRTALGRLFRLRVALHLLTGEKTDQIRIEYQKKLAEMIGIKPRAGLDEDALLNYAIKASEIVEESLDRMVFRLKEIYEDGRRKSIPKISWAVESQNRIYILEDEFKKEFKEKNFILIELLKLVGQFGLSLAPFSRSILRKSVSGMKQLLRSKIMDIFAREFKTSFAIKELKISGILKSLIPELDSAFYLGQRDGYHIYTVGEHSLRCLKQIEECEKEPEFGDDPEINWSILKMAALIHDLGKGRGPDHLKAGAEIARMVSKRFYLGKESELLEFLISEHMLLNHYAQRRDYYEPKACEYLIKKIKDSSRLKMLFILTCADIRAVSDKSWTSWKAELLRGLYHFLLIQMEKRETPSALVEKRISDIIQLVDGKDLELDLIKELRKLPTRYLLGTSPEKLLSQLHMVSRKKPGEIFIQIQALDKPRLELTIICDDRPGLFSELSGVLSSLNYNILSAEINTLKKNSVLDIFLIEDLVTAKAEHWDSELVTRNERLKKTLIEAIEKKICVQDLIRRKRGIFKRRSALKIIPEIQADQESSENYTILEVQAQDQPGLLYQITRTIFEQGLDIHFAKISTRAEKVFDVFYLQNQASGGKVSNEIISKLVDAIFSSLKEKADPHWQKN